MPTPIIVVPARMASTRLPGKPLALINGVPMILHVLARGQEAGLGPVVIAAADQAIVDVVTAHGGDAVLTDPDHASGSDRIVEAIGRFDPGRRFDTIINVQGDLPTIAPAAIAAALHLLTDPKVDIGTLAAEITRPTERDDPNVVKAVFEPASIDPRRGRALYFTRATAPTGKGPLYHHIGLYAYRRDALDRFVTAPPSFLERRERLEQLRALALGLRIEVALVDDVPLGVDTPEDLPRAAALLEAQGYGG